MQQALQPGLKGTFTLKVERKHCTSRGGPWVFATPEMVRFSERSCHELVAPHLSAGQHTVGAVQRWLQWHRATRQATPS